MRLRLNTTLRAALIAAITTVGLTLSQAQAGMATTTTVNLDDNIEYNGKIITMSGAGGSVSGRTFTGYVQNPEGTGMIDSGTYNWQYFANNKTEYGNTMRLLGLQSGTTTYTSDFSPFSLGGLIVEQGSGSYVLGRSNTAIDFNGVSDVNLNIKGNVQILANSGTGIAFVKGGKWVVESEKILEFKTTQAVVLDSGIAVNVSGGGKALVTGNLTTNAGATVAVSSGTTFEVTGTTTLGGTITNNGTIKFATDTVTLGSLAGFESSATYTNYTGGATGNGFAGTIVYTIIKGEGQSNLAKVNYGDQQAVELSGGKLTVEGDVDYTKYYLVTDNTSMSVKAASDFAAEHDGAVLSTVYVKGANDTVNVDMNFGGTVEASATGAILNIQEDYVYSGTASGVALKGAGTYELTPNTATLGTGVTFDSTWTGVVRVTSASVNNLDFSTLTNGTASTLELKGYTGWSNQWKDGTNNENIKLTSPGDGAYAWTNRSDTTSTGLATKFTGKWSGNGTFAVAPRALGYTFKGDISEWTGAIVNIDDRGYTSVITFADNATDVKASITDKENAKFAVVVSTNAVFSNSVSVHGALTVDAGKTATLKGQSTIGTLAGLGALTVNADTHTVAIGGGTIANTITLQAGTLTLSGAFALDNMQVQDERTEFIGGEGIAVGSGFKQTSGTIDVVNVGTGATLNIDQAATFTYNSSAVTVNATTGDVSLSGTPDYTSLWINGATTVSYTAAQTIADEHSATVGTVHLNADGATVTMDKADAAVALVLTEGISGTVNATAATTISSLTGPVAEKTLTVDGNSVVAIQSADAFAGNVNVIGGTVKLGSNSALGAHNATGDKTITIGTGATIDVNGQGDAKYVYTLAGGTLTNMGNAIGHNMAQTSGLVLTDDSYIGSEGSKEMWVLAGSYAVNTVNLDNHKLTKKGTGTVGFSNSDISAGTLQVDGGTLQFNDDNQQHGSIAANIVLNGGTVAGTLNQSGNISVTANEETSTGATINVGNNTLTLSTDEDKTLTLTGGISVGDTGSVKVEGAGTLLVNSTLNLGGKLTAAGNIAVGESGNLTLTAGSTVYQTIDNEGTVSLTGVTLGEGFQEQGDGTGYYDLEGNVTTSDANHYEGTGSTYVQVVNGGNATGSDIQWNGKGYNLEENGTIIVGSGTPTYDTFFVVTEAATSDIIAGSHYDQLNTIVVSDWAELNVDEAVSGKSIEVKEGGFISGSAMTPESLSMDAQAVAIFNNDVTTANGIVFSDQVLVSMTNTNEDGSPVQYSTGEKAIAVNADKMEMTGNADVTVSNQLVVDEIVNTTTHALTLDNVEDTLELVNMDITNSTVKVYTNLAPETEATVSISGVLQGGGATLQANLTLVGGADSMLDVDGGGLKALTLGSTLAIDTTDGLVNLDQETIAALNALEVGQSLDLIKALQGTQLAYDGAAAGAQWYGDLFNRADGLQGDYKVYANDGAFGLVKQSSVPEPTTGTLSLLALAALAARRRRK